MRILRIVPFIAMMLMNAVPARAAHLTSFVITGTATAGTNIFATVSVSYDVDRPDENESYWSGGAFYNSVSVTFHVDPALGVTNYVCMPIASGCTGGEDFVFSFPLGQRSMTLQIGGPQAPQASQTFTTTVTATAHNANYPLPPDPQALPIDPGMSQTVTVSPGLPTITGNSIMWWFGGVSPAGWNTSSVLSSSVGGATSWAIVNGADKVHLSSTNGGQVTVTSTGTNFSGAIDDIRIRATGPAGSGDFLMTLKRPYVLSPNLLYASGTSNVQNTCSGTNYVYRTLIAYSIRDQFGQALNAAVPMSEQWTSNFVKDYKKTTWSTNITAQGLTTSNATFADGIEGDAPTATPTPVCDGSTATKVLHWGQAWRVGSAAVGSGQRVQTDTIQKYTGIASHLSVATPAP